MQETSLDSIEIEASIGNSNYETSISYHGHQIKADEPLDKGGTNTGMTPKQLLASSLASCIAITLKMYADIKEYKMEQITVRSNYLSAFDKENPQLNVEVKLEGDLDEKAVKRMGIIAQKCPIHKLLAKSITINTTVYEVS